jgi:hypothetical protein
MEAGAVDKDLIRKACNRRCSGKVSSPTPCSDVTHCHSLTADCCRVAMRPQTFWRHATTALIPRGDTGWRFGLPVKISVYPNFRHSSSLPFVFIAAFSETAVRMWVQNKLWKCNCNNRRWKMACLLQFFNYLAPVYNRSKTTIFWVTLCYAFVLDAIFSFLFTKQNTDMSN